MINSDAHKMERISEGNNEYYPKSKMSANIYTIKYHNNEIIQIMKDFVKTDGEEVGSVIEEMADKCTK